MSTFVSYKSFERGVTDQTRGCDDSSKVEDFRSKSSVRVSSTKDGSEHHMCRSIDWFPDYQTFHKCSFYVPTSISSGSHKKKESTDTTDGFNECRFPLK